MLSSASDAIVNNKYINVIAQSTSACFFFPPAKFQKVSECAFHLQIEDADWFSSSVLEDELWPSQASSVANSDRSRNAWGFLCHGM